MYEVKLHDIGEGMTEGEVVSILVNVGDMVQMDQPLMEVQTDKVSAELPTPVAGRVAEICVQIGERVPVGQTIAKIEQHTYVNQSSSEQAIAQTASSTQTSTDTQTNEIRPERVQHNKCSRTEGVKLRRNIMAAPYTRKVAREYGIEIEEVQGTGPNGRVTVEDVQAYAQSQHEGSEAEVATAQELEQRLPLISETAQVSTSRAEVRGNIEKPKPGATIPFRGRRKQIAQKMVQSMYTIPHVTHFDKLDMTSLMEMREQYQQGKSGAEARNSRLSVMSFVVKAISIALQEYPIFNAKLNEERGVIELMPTVNIGYAVHTDEGLIVPVIPQVESRSIIEIQQEMKALTQKAQEDRLTASDLRGGTFTVSNVGPIGGMFATPIINYPEVALLAFHQMEDQPVVRKKQIVIRTMMNFSMSFDHRVADGVTAVQFTNRVKQLLEEPLQLFVHLR